MKLQRTGMLIIATAALAVSAPPAHAADTIEILRELGLTPAQIDALAETGGIRPTDAAQRTRKTG